ncbi:MAG TPA: hypothetical protein DGX96_08835 [Lachnospiraceae bacterium]|jgi:hypothetical protein|nr:hypothetical protein [Lachnospiraceae bacterium]
MAEHPDVRLTVVCCYNDEAQMQQLKESLYTQNIAFRLMLIDNRQGRFSSAAGAYNGILDQVDTPYVVFCHQDVLFTGTDLLERFLKYLSEIKEGDILGVAGGRQGCDYVLTGIHTDLQGTCVPGSRLVDGMETCDIVDECFFGGSTKTFQEAPFDEKLCPGWHLYAAERCLHAKEEGHQVLVCDLPVVHTSGGTISADYNRTFLAVSKRYAGTVWFLRTTCCYAPTTFPLRDLAYLYRKIKLRLGMYGRKN